ncbi:hypothetical protein GCM10022280_05660 [Sphingomonas swuensis]|uniref:Uncharacterized protein n=1 Tax=Sphingomonas swuensis TaxID=977800 RepID=A0ABP7SFI0_9SPHN
MLGENDGAGIAAALDHGAQEGGHGDAAFRVDPVQGTALKQMLQCHRNNSPARWTDLTRSPERGVTASDAGPTVMGSAPCYDLCVTREAMGLNGISWEMMG